jgi:hypothetical protein
MRTAGRWRTAHDGVPAGGRSGRQLHRHPAGGIHQHGQEGAEAGHAVNPATTGPGMTARPAVEVGRDRQSDGAMVADGAPIPCQVADIPGVADGIRRRCDARCDACGRDRDERIPIVPTTGCSDSGESEAACARTVRRLQGARLLAGSRVSPVARAGACCLRRPVRAHLGGTPPPPQRRPQRSSAAERSLLAGRGDSVS